MRRQCRHGHQLAAPSHGHGEPLRLRHDSHGIPTSPEQIIDEWTRQTLGNNPKVVYTMNHLQLDSWKAYEQYTGPLGIGTLTDIIGYHYGPGIESAERNGWGQWFRADHEGVGMDRTVATGTGYIGQYPPELARVYEVARHLPRRAPAVHAPRTLHHESPHRKDRNPAHLRLPLRRRRNSRNLRPTLGDLRGHIDDQRYAETLKLFHYQAGHAMVWRDAVSEWFQHLSGIPDARGRVGNYPNRIEAEAHDLRTGYTVTDVHPWETASRRQSRHLQRPRAAPSPQNSTCPPAHTTLPSNTSIFAEEYRTTTSSTQRQANRPLGRGRHASTRSRRQRNLDGHTSTRFTCARRLHRTRRYLTLRRHTRRRRSSPRRLHRNHTSTKETPKTMKITAARLIICSPDRNFVTLRIETDEGIYGLGDATLNGRELAVAAYLEEHVLPCLIGRDPFQTEDIWQYLYRGAYWRRGARDHDRHRRRRRRPLGHQGQGTQHPRLQPARRPIPRWRPRLHPRQRSRHPRNTRLRPQAHGRGLPRRSRPVRRPRSRHQAMAFQKAGKPYEPAERGLPSESPLVDGKVPQLRPIPLRKTPR